LIIVMLLATGVAFITTLWLTRCFLKPGSFFYLLDHPNERSLHANPVPRSGGVAVLAGMLTGTTVLSFVIAFSPVHALSLGLLPLVVVSFWDDRASVNPVIRLLAQGLAAALLLNTGYGVIALEQDWLVGGIFKDLVDLITITLVIWMINLYNFMDGMDGLAGGMAIFGFGCYGILGLLAGNAAFASTGFLIAGAAGGFLVYNFPPAKIFLGDTGSTTLGYCAAALGLWGHNDGILTLWIAMLIFAPFIVDATVTLAWRLLRAEKVWQAHQSHCYQRLVQIGWSQRNVLWVEYFLMFTSCLVALCAMDWPVKGQIGLTGVWFLFCALLMFSLSRSTLRCQ
jgi:UDP-N-acetylmuramyl pentapeptide phosphotransferase/UDP-N-acetylglucosamine-1-phosphate transferase